MDINIKQIEHLKKKNNLNKVQYFDFSNKDKIWNGMLMTKKH